MIVIKKVFRRILLIFIFANALSCKIADISQPSNLSAIESEQIAVQKLEETITKQGFLIMKEKKLYQFEAIDDWRGFLGGLAKIWPDRKTRFLFKHNFNTFDGIATFLDGKRSGDTIGVQSWVYYEKNPETSLYENMDTPNKFNKLEFGMVIFHYFLELPYRLRNAPIKRYYGKRTNKGVTYDLVFATWGTETANKEFDQYILWINSETKLVDYCVYTLRDNNNPFTRQKYGSIAYLNHKDIEGVKIPFKMPVLLDDVVISKPSLDKYFHQFSIEHFSFGGYSESELYPFSKIQKQGDEK